MKSEKVLDYTLHVIAALAAIFAVRTGNWSTLTWIIVTTLVTIRTQRWEETARLWRETSVEWHRLYDELLEAARGGATSKKSTN